MKRLIWFVGVTSVALGASIAAQSVPELNFEANADVLTLPADPGVVAGVATNWCGHIFVYARTGHAVATLGDERTFYHGGARLFQFDQSGKFVRDIWTGDLRLRLRVAGADSSAGQHLGGRRRMASSSNALNTIFFDSEGRFLMVIGRKPESIPVRQGPGVPARVLDDPSAGATASAAGPGGGGGGGGGPAAKKAPPGAGTHSESFNRPTDIAFDKQGKSQIAYGMENEQSDCGLQPRWQLGARTGDRPDQGQGSSTRSAGSSPMPPAISTWRIRATTAFKSSTAQGTFKSQITGIGSPQAICITGGSPQYLYSSNSNDPESMDNGEIYKISTRRKSRRPSSARPEELPSEFGMVNSLDCRSENTLWVGEVWNWRAQKVTLKR